MRRENDTDYWQGVIRAAERTERDQARVARAEVRTETLRENVEADRADEVRVRRSVRL